MARVVLDTCVCACVCHCTPLQATIHAYTLTRGSRHMGMCVCVRVCTYRYTCTRCYRHVTSVCTRTRVVIEIHVFALAHTGAPALKYRRRQTLQEAFVVRYVCGLKRYV